MHTQGEPRPPSPHASSARRWLGLSIGSLLAAGALAILLVIGRMPPFAGWLSDPLLFKRGLVVHVDLALVVWFYAFLGCLSAQIPARRHHVGVDLFGFAMAAIGVGALLAATFVSGVQPVLSNYVPVLDHPLFLAGLAAFGVGLGVALLDGRLLPGREQPEATVLPPAARPGVRAAGVAFLLALLTFAGAALSTPGHLPLRPRYELICWGGGHLLQFVSVLAMVSVWLTLLTGALGREPVSRRTATVLFGVLLTPALAGPLLLASGADAPLAREGFTRLMQWGIFPVVLVFLALCLRAVARDWPGWRAAVRDVRLTGFGVSALLATLGFVLGALIRGPNTMIPAHYHASIGAVTASYMAVAFVLLEPLGWRLPEGRATRLAAWQPILFGLGQAVFAVGFGFAGAHGAARKAYATEQAVRSFGEWLGLVVMGLGGLVAACGGLLFLGLIATAWIRSARTHTASSRGEPAAPWRTAPWNPTAEPNTPSRDF